MEERTKFPSKLAASTYDLIEKSKTVGISSGASAPEILVENFIENLKKKFTVSIDEVEIIKENVVFKAPKKLN